MRIGVDARPLISETPSGIGIYLLEILKNLEEKEGTEYILYSNEPIRNREPALKRFSQRVVKGRIGTLAVCFGLRRQLLKDQIDVFWGTEHMLPLNCRKIKRFLTVHDLALMIHPGWGSRKNAVMQNLFCRLSCRRADRILAVSEATKRDLVRILRMDEGRITVVPNGGSYPDACFSAEEEEKTGQRLGTAGRLFFSYTGTIEPRKNVTGIVRAFELLNRRSGGRYFLVLAGKMGWRTEALREAIAQSEFKDQILLPGYISEEEKKYLMRQALAFVFPSHYEGFGIPVTEALSCGGIVITARNSSLPEVGGPAAFYISDSGDTEELARQMQQCAELSAEERTARIEAGRKYAQRFCWEKCAQRTQSVLEA